MQKGIWKTSNAVGIGRRVLLMRGQRSAGRHLVGPIFARTEWLSEGGTRYLNITVGNPKKHAKWAFSLWIYPTIAKSKSDFYND